MKKSDKQSTGLLVGLLFALCNMISASFRSGWVYRFLCSHEKAKNAFDSSATAVISGILRAKCRRYTEAVKKYISGQFERSLIIRFMSYLAKGLISLPGRVYGAFGLTWGAYVLLIFFIKSMALGESPNSMVYLLPGAIAFLASFPLLFSDKPLVFLCEESPLIFMILTKVFGIPCESLKAKSNVKAGQSGAVILGIISGLLTYFIPPLYMILGVLSLIVVSLIFAYPEGGVVISIATAPFLGIAKSPSLLLAQFVILTALSYFIKVIRGKRVFRMGITGLTVYAFMAAVFLSGFAPGESNTLASALLCCSLMLIFPLVVNLMTYKHWINVCLVSFAVPSAIIAFIGIAQHLLGLSPSGWVDEDLFSQISSRAVSLFNNPNIFGVYLAALFPVSLMLTLPKYNYKIRTLGVISSCYIVIAGVFTFSRSAWLAILVGGIIFAVLVSPKGFMWILPVSAVVVGLALLFPETVGARLINFASQSDSANNYRVSVWNSSWALLSDVFLSGIGWGEEAFRVAYINYGADGTQYAMHSHSLYMQIAIQSGLIGLVLFFSSMISIIFKCFGSVSKKKNRDSAHLYSKAAISGALAILTAGIFDYTWYNYRIFFIFWALLGFACAVANVGDKEYEYDHNMSVDECYSYIVVEIPKNNSTDSDDESKNGGKTQ